MGIDKGLDYEVLEFWSYLVLGLQETANFRYGDPRVKTNAYTYEDAIYCQGLYEDYVGG